MEQPHTRPRLATSICPGDRICVYNAETEKVTFATVKAVVPRSNYVLFELTRGKPMPVPIAAHVDVVVNGWVAR